LGDPEESLPPTPDVYDELLKASHEAVEVANSVREDADAGVFKGEKGEKGDKGEAGVVEFIVVAELPTKDIKNAIYLLPEKDADGSNLFAEYIYVNGKWEQIGSASVEINLDEFVKKTDYATGTVAGVVRVGAGLKMEPYGLLITNPAGLSSIDARANKNAPIVPNTVDYAVRAALTNPKNVTWSEGNKTAARETLGAASADELSKTSADVKAVELIAKGRATGYVFDTIDDLDVALTDSTFTEKLVLGDNLYIRATDVPDYWWDGTQKQPLETQKVDLSGYVKTIDYDSGYKYPGGSDGTYYGLLYARKFDNTECCFPVCGQNRNYTIPVRDHMGNFYVASPTFASHCATKGYVDGLISGLIARIEALESQLNAEQ
jgi:hypothetical protein